MVRLITTRSTVCRVLHRDSASAQERLSMEYGSLDLRIALFGKSKSKDSDILIECKFRILKEVVNGAFEIFCGALGLAYPSQRNRHFAMPHP